MQVGWGFTDHAWLQGGAARSIGPDAKRDHLLAFVQQRLGGWEEAVTATTTTGPTAIS
jgi:hypothetical protein